MELFGCLEDTLGRSSVWSILEVKEWT
jgi:hypothetical protein